tara:strand:- start:169 stop:561 length:393 start_codon:yes stop_codon:yes gene_type:complete
MTKKPTFTTKTYSKGDLIYSHNDRSEYVYLIESGQVKIVTKQGLELGILKEGEIFGEIGHIIERSRTVTAIALTNCLIKAIHEKTIKEKINEADPVLSAIIRSLSLRIGDANNLAEKFWLELNIYKSLKE